MKHIFKTLSTVVASAVALVIIGGFGIQLAQAQGAPAPAPTTTNKSVEAACEGIEAAGGTCESEADARNTFEGIIENIINILAIVVGAVCVVMIIIGGFRYVVANGDSNAVQGAKNTIIYAIVGLAIVIFSRTIVVFVISQFKD